MVRLKYSEISNFQFAQAMQKIASTPTHGQVASQIHKVTKKLTAVRNQISKEYQDKIVATFGKKDEAGAVIRPAGEPMGFEPIEEKQAEFMTAQEEFGNTEVELPVNPFNVQLLGDIKVSAQDLEALKGLYAGNNEDDAEKPALPSNVASLR